MRELTVRIRFMKPCLGNVKSQHRAHNGIYLMPRNPQGFITFLASWHKANLRFAAQLLNKHQDEVDKIHFDIQVDGALQQGRHYKRYYKQGSNSRYVMHEAFQAGQEVGIHCVVPASINDDDFWRLMQIAGQYRGISPFKPGEYGQFEVVAVLPRRRSAAAHKIVNEHEGT